MRITAIVTQKGGTGKTTTAQALTSGLTLAGYSALAIDADPQGNLTYSMGAENQHGLFDVLNGASPAELIQHTDQGDILASTPELIGAEMLLTKRGREYALRRALDRLKGRYDHVIIDCPPGLGIITINALTAAYDVIIPLEATVYSQQGLGQLHSTLQLVRQKSNAGLRIAGILLNKYNDRSNIYRATKQAIEDTAAMMGTSVYAATVRAGVAIPEAQLKQESIYQARRAKVAADLAAFVKEYIRQEGNT